MIEILKKGKKKKKEKKVSSVLFILSIMKVVRSSLLSIGFHFKDKLSNFSLLVQRIRYLTVMN